MSSPSRLTMQAVSILFPKAPLLPRGGEAGTIARSFVRSCIAGSGDEGVVFMRVYVRVWEVVDVGWPLLPYVHAWRQTRIKRGREGERQTDIDVMKA
jgi:hypothetical protein